MLTNDELNKVNGLVIGDRYALFYYQTHARGYTRREKTMKTCFSKFRLALFILLGIALLGACAPQPGTVTYENYEKLTFGMAYEKVVDILGNPQRVEPFMGIKQCTWANGERHIHAKFIAGRAVYYSSKGLRPPATPSRAHKPAG
jgi:hypothetical protein